MTDTFLLIIRWLHAIAAVAWIGGGIFYWVVLRPAIRSGEVPASVTRFTGAEFGQVVALAMWALVITGAILMLTRLSEPTATLPYGVVLGVKVALSAWMFFLTVGRRRRGDADAAPGKVRSAVNALGHVNMTVVLGIVVFGLSDILRFLVERDLVS
jgi:uncharacterized membrane protein